jgi:hypothetical protein
MPKSKKRTSKKKRPRGPKPDHLRVDGPWRHAVQRAIIKKRPPEGWPESPKGRSK